MAYAVAFCMGVRKFTEFKAWQLGNRLKCEVYDFTDRLPAKRDLRFCDDIRDSSASIPSNIAEGFGRFDHKEFAQFVKISLASATETANHLIDAFQRRYLSRREYHRLAALAHETTITVNGLYRYLRTHPTPPRDDDRRPPPDDAPGG